jgi:hypothetical protein
VRGEKDVCHDSVVPPFAAAAAVAAAAAAAAAAEHVAFFFVCLVVSTCCSQPTGLYNSTETGAQAVCCGSPAMQRHTCRTQKGLLAPWPVLLLHLAQRMLCTPVLQHSFM